MGQSLAIENLKFSYVKDRPVIQIERLVVEPGERVFIFGPSGCGKTTLLGLIAGVLPIQEGRISAVGGQLEKLTMRERDRFRGAHMGYIFQMFNLIPYLNVFENIVLPCELNSVRRARIPGPIDDEVRELTSKLGIVDLLERRVTDLSVGQQQRVAAARALLGHPELIIADEPTSALDADHRAAFLDVLLKQASSTGATVLFVSHDRSLATSFDRTLSIPDLNKALGKSDA